MLRRHFLLSAAASALTGAGLAGTAQAMTAPAGPHPADAQEAILSAFDRYELVGGFSPGHGVKDTDDFLITLIRNPRLPYAVQDIAVEGGNSLYQPILDQYLAGEDVPLSQVEQVWRNTTQPNVGFSTFYQQLYPLVRRINATLPPPRRMRVLACDSPIDWSTVTSLQDVEPFMNRDRYIANTIEQEILAKHRKALLLFGVAHVQHHGGAGAIYEQDHPGVSYVIADHRGFATDNDQLEQRMTIWPVPSLTTIAGTWLADLDSSYFFAPPDDHGYPGVDGYLYNGPRDYLMHQPISARTVLDPTYLAELQRRATITGGPASPQAILQNEAASTPFFYNP